MSYRQSITSPQYIYTASPQNAFSEPMHIGSSPTSPTSQQVQYLPGFLMGDSVQKPSHTSPTNNLTMNSGFSSGEIVQPSRMQAHAQLSRKPRISNPRQNAAAPPTQSLWALPTSPATRTKLGTANANNNNNNGCGDRLYESLTSTSSVSQNENGYDETWVTVFGYPASKGLAILQQFAQLGTIERYVITNSGNWMHIKYQNRLQVKCALSKNGRVFVDNIMLGVQPCSDKEVMRRTTCEASQPPIALSGAPRHLNKMNTVSVNGDGNHLAEKSLNRSFDCGMAGVGKQLAMGGEPSLVTGMSSPRVGGGGGGGVVRHSSMRSLAGTGYAGRTVVGGGPGGGLTRSESTKQNGMFTKALGYMFGWN